jgi:hypothetical protein
MMWRQVLIIGAAVLSPAPSGTGVGDGLSVALLGSTESRGSVRGGTVTTPTTLNVDTLMYGLTVATRVS